MSEKTSTPAVPGLFEITADGPRLVGSRCRACGAWAFPRQKVFCRNPACAGEELDVVHLSTRGRVWSYTDACYQPPAPYVPVTDPFQPFAIAAVELGEERLVVLGQVADGVPLDALAVGTEVELEVDTLYEDDAHVYTVWKWRPVAAGTAITA